VFKKTRRWQVGNPSRLVQDFPPCGPSSNRRGRFGPFVKIDEDAHGLDPRQIDEDGLDPRQIDEGAHGLDPRQVDEDTHGPFNVRATVHLTSGRRPV